MAAVRGVLEKAGVPESALECGTHPLGDSVAAEALARAGMKPLPVHNNCSGKHAGTLKLATHMGWPTARYFAPEHPVQKRMLQVVAGFCDLPQDRVELGTDGCGVCVFAVPLRNTALAFARLAFPDVLEPTRAAAEGFCTALSRAVTVTVVELLRQLGVLGAGELSRLGKWRQTRVLNWRGEECGEMMPVFKIV